MRLARTVHAPYWAPHRRYAINIRDGVDWARYLRVIAPCVARRDLLSVARSVRVHVLIDTLGVGGAEVLLADFAAVASAGGVELSVGYLKDAGAGHAADRLRAVGVEPRCVAIPPRLGSRPFGAPPLPRAGAP